MRIKGYTIKSEISRGPITSAFLANQNNLDRQVLLKILNVQWRKDMDLVERFRREAKISARLKHQNIVTIFDFGISDNAFYIAMEYIEGLELNSFIKKNYPLPYSLIAYILRETLQGLAYAHQKEVLHRDIKPRNIMIGDNGDIKIADFGLATIAEFPRLTNQDDIVGTPAYMSPEQAKGSKLDYRSDLFSLGVTLYEMITGKSPFLDRNLAITINNILTKTPPSPATVRKDVPEWLTNLTVGLLEKDIQKRPDSVQKVLHTTQKYLENINYNELKPFFAHFPFHKPYYFSSSKSGKKGVRSIKPRNLVIYLSTLFIMLVFIIVFIIFSSPNEIPEIKTSPAVTIDTSDKNKLNKTIIDDQPQNKPALTDLIKPPSKTAEMSLSTSNIKVKPKIESENQIRTNEQFSAEERKSIPLEKQTGQLFIACHPWANIIIDDKFVETTPLLKPITLSAGTHLLELQNPNYRLYSSEITIISDSTDTLNITLEPAIGYLNVQIIPWGKIHINNQYLETTPLSDPLTLFAGKHQIRITNPNYRDITDSIFIEAGETVEKIFYFNP